MYECVCVCKANIGQYMLLLVTPNLNDRHVFDFFMPKNTYDMIWYDLLLLRQLLCQTVTGSICLKSLHLYSVSRYYEAVF